MAFSDVAYRPAAALPAIRGLVPLQRGLLWAIGAGGAIVFFEPSPYEIATLLAILFFGATGLRMRPVFVPLLALLVAINLGYTICAAYLLDRPAVLSWIVTSWYMAITALLFAMVLSEDTAARLELLRRGLMFGGVVASLAAVLGYFNLIPGLYDTFTLYSRARGTFKDPNVLSAFLILPALFALQDVLTARFGKAMRAGLIVSIIGLGLLLAFSRAAWGQMVLTSVFMVVVMLLTADSARQRSRIIVLSVLAVLIAAMLLALLLSLDSVGALFKERASFDQSYDEGRFGRFGRHILGAQMALDLPLGIGPLQFTRFFPEDTHNSYLNAFMSGGWISGVCYPVLIVLTVMLGFRSLMKHTPWQRSYIPLFAAFLGAAGESLVIDSDHWRHFWLMLGAVWGIAAATRAAMPGRAPQVLG
jgi:hypothetical protein